MEALCWGGRHAERHTCLVAHSYGGLVGSGVIERVAAPVSSIVWVDAFLPTDGERPMDVNPATRAAVDAALESGNAGLPPVDASEFVTSEADRVWVNSKMTSHPIGTLTRPMRLTGAREKVARKTYVRPV